VTRAELVKTIGGALDERLLVEDPPTIPGTRRIEVAPDEGFVLVQVADESYPVAGRIFAICVTDLTDATIRVKAAA
jgi:hypothetical protein